MIVYDFSNGIPTTYSQPIISLAGGSIKDCFFSDDGKTFTIGTSISPYIYNYQTTIENIIAPYTNLIDISKISQNPAFRGLGYTQAQYAVNAQATINVMYAT